MLALEGINADGKKVVEAYPDFEGKSCRDVVGDLVTEINEAGYFDTTIEGHEKNIILKLAKGSEYPDDDFLEGIAEEVRTTVEANQIGSRRWLWMKTIMIRLWDPRAISAPRQPGILSPSSWAERIFSCRERI